MNAPDKKIQAALLPDEKILWSGKPDPKIIFSSSDIFQIPFSLFVCSCLSISILDSAMDAMSLPSTNADRLSSWIFPLLSIPFLLAGLYMLIGRFIYKGWKKSQVYYAVTNKRAIIFTKSQRQNVQFAYIETLPVITKLVRKSGVGTIIFGNHPSFSSFRVNSGIESSERMCEDIVPAFCDIAEVNKVYEIVTKLR